MNEFVLNRLLDHEDETLLNEIRCVADMIETGYITIPEFDKKARITASSLARRFGSWSKALQKAGVGHRFCRPSSYLLDEELIERLKQVAKQTGRPYVTKTEFTEYTEIDTTCFLRRFGSWRNALEKAGLRQTPRGKRYTDEECFENMLKVWTHYGRPPGYLEMKEFPSTVGPKAYITRWKTWNKALHAFVDKVSSDEPEVSPELEEADSNVTICTPSSSSETLPSKRVSRKDEDKREIKLGLRYRVLKRDDFKCVLCGRSPANTAGLELHVDHIMPFSNGGKTVEKNLRTTCVDCNLGKGAKIEKT